MYIEKCKRHLEMVHLYHGDCLEVMKDIPDGSVDLVVTDCPYHIVQGGCSNNSVTFKAMSGILNKQRQFENVSKEFVKAGKIFKHNDIEFREWLPEIYRVLKQDSHCYIMINGRNLKDLQIECEKVGFKFLNLIVWDKGNQTPNKWYMNSVEFILFLRKGKAKKINNLGVKNILRVPNIQKGKKTHPTEKPIDLMKTLIENSSFPQGVVLDPFMGTGSTGVACVNTNRKFIGIEIDRGYFEIASERMSEALKEVDYENED